MVSTRPRWNNGCKIHQKNPEKGFQIDACLMVLLVIQIAHETLAMSCSQSIIERLQSISWEFYDGINSWGSQKQSKLFIISWRWKTDWNFRFRNWKTCLLKFQNFGCENSVTVWTWKFLFSAIWKMCCSWCDKNERYC